MKINSNTPPLRSDLPTTATASGRTTNRAAAPQGGAAVPSGAASAVSAVSTSAVSSDFNAQKVQSVGSAIANGSYKVDSGAIADKLLGHAGELAKRK